MMVSNESPRARTDSSPNRSAEDTYESASQGNHTNIRMHDVLHFGYLAVQLPNLVHATVLRIELLFSHREHHTIPIHFHSCGSYHLLSEKRLKLSLSVAGFQIAVGAILGGNVLKKFKADTMGEICSGSRNERHFIFHKILDSMAFPLINFCSVHGREISLHTLLFVVLPRKSVFGQSGSQCWLPETE